MDFEILFREIKQKNTNQSNKQDDSKIFQKGMAKFDVFGQTITLRMNKQNFYKTAFGGFVSLLLFLTMVIIFTQNLISFYNKENLTATVLTSFEETPSLAILNDQNFVFAVQIEQDDFIKNPFFQITIQQRSEIRYQNGSKISNNINLQLIPCTIHRFEPTFTKRNLNITQQFKDLDLQNFLCLDLNTTYQIQGTNTSIYFIYKKDSIYNYLKISVNSCNKSQICATDEDRNAHIQINGSYKLKFFTINSIINPQHPDNEYIQIFIDDSFYMKFLPSDIYKTVDVFLKEYNIYNDDSLTPFSDISLSTYYILDQSAMSEKVEFNSNNSNELATLYIRKSPYKTYVYRSYLKIDELLSNLGGIQQIFFFFLGIILSLYNRFQLLVELANKLFEFQLISLQHVKIEEENLEQVNQLLTERNMQIELQSKRQSQQGLQINQINLSMIKQQKNNNELKFNQNPHNNETQQNFSNQPSNKNETDTKKFFFRQSTRQSKNLFNINQLQNGLDYFQQQISILINRSQPILLSFTMIVNFISCNKCCKNKKNIQLMNKAIDQITDQIDLFNILTKLNELEKIKEVIFTPEQQLIFGFTPKPLISLDMTKVQINRQYLQSMNPQHSDIKQTTQNDEQKINPIQKAQRGMHLKGDQQLYQEIYAAYDEILQDQDQDIINKQLIKKLGPEVQKIFKLSKLMDQQKKQIRTQVRKKLIKHDDDMLITD